ncbi:MAG: DUF1918 domain-containing protein [Kribbellaceae bacterium]
MHANPGEWLIVEGTHLHDAQRHGLILEVHHPDGTPPYLVRWSDTGTEALVFPGSDARVVTEPDLRRHPVAD